MNRKAIAASIIASMALLAVIVQTFGVRLRRSHGEFGVTVLKPSYRSYWIEYRHYPGWFYFAPTNGIEQAMYPVDGRWCFPKFRWVSERATMLFLTNTTITTMTNVVLIK